jgi:dinuclear metal center YbgI/SA1388 family protein
MKVQDVVKLFDDFAPAIYQESYDNSGLLIGSPDMEVRGVLLTIDITLEILDEAVSHNCNLIVSHHPVIFSGLKKITGDHYTEQIVIKAIQNQIAIISSHTSMDAVFSGVNEKICNKLGLGNLKLLSETKGNLRKLVTFVPKDHIQKVQEALFSAGAGKIGNYDSCSFNTEGYGSFRAGEDSNPFVGEKGKLHLEPEIRIETIFPVHLKGKVLSALRQSHPYEEIAYDIYALDNVYTKVGMGMVGEFEEPMSENEFLRKLKSVFSSGSIRHTEFTGQKVRKVAVCGGSGAFLLEKSIDAGAQFFVTGDMKYHQFFDAQKKIVIADIGHYESEQFTTEIFYDLITKKFPKFAVRFSEINTNPIKYF